MDTSLNMNRGSFPVCITCQADLSALHNLRTRVYEFAERCGFQGEDAIKIEMAVDEACSNVARHAYAEGDEAALMTVEMELSANALTIVVIDQGRGIQTEDLYGVPTIGDYCRADRAGFSGLGLHIMKQFMDEFEVISKPNGGTRVMLRKYRCEAA